MATESTTHPENQPDVIVVGGGPAGNTAAITLARNGRSVLLLERSELPRFHIGESLLPGVIAVLQRLGLAERMEEQGFVAKHGAEISWPEWNYFGRIPFSEQGDGWPPATYQVERARFDNVLTQCARDAGVRVLEQATVKELIVDGDRVTGVRYSHGGHTTTATAPYVIDASGRAGKVAQTFGLRKPDPRRRMVAVFRHLGGFNDDHNPGVRGDIQVAIHQDGWVWVIPLAPDKVSVGSVMPKSVLQQATDRDALLEDHLSRDPRVAQRLQGTTDRGKLSVETDYTYYADTVTGPGWFMAGDAGCFTDPVFSAGVTLAMLTGHKAGETVDAILSEPGRAEELQHRYADFYKTGYDVYGRFVHAYYEDGYNIRPFIERAGVTIAGAKDWENKWVVRLLAGEFWDDRNPLVQYLRKRTDWDVLAPFEPDWVGPFAWAAELTA